MAQDTVMEDREVATIRRMYDSIAAGDFDTMRACFAPGAVIWHNFDDTEKGVDQSVEVLSHLCAISDDIQYAWLVVEGAGKVRFPQYTLTADLRSGAKLHLPAMMRVELDDEARVVRIDEYFDSRSTDVLAA